MINKDFSSILDLLQTFSNEQICIEHLEELRWNGRVVSPFDSSSKVYKCKGNKYRCKNTSKYFNVKTGTLFDNTKVKLQKWFLAIWLVTSHKKGISSIQLAKDIDVTQKTAWFMLQRIRNCFGIENDRTTDGEVKKNEPYMGSKNKNHPKDKEVTNSQGRISKDKASAFVAIKRGAKLNAAIVKHNQGEYVNGRIHTSAIEGFLPFLKHSIYHFAFKKYLKRYVDKFIFRYKDKQIVLISY